MNKIFRAAISLIAIAAMILLQPLNVLATPPVQESITLDSITENGAEVTLAGTAETHSADLSNWTIDINWGDSQTTTGITLTATDDNSIGSWTASHTYETAGEYSISFLLKKNGATQSSVVNGETPTVTLANPVPEITSISPESLVFGGSAFTLTVTGTNFGSNSVINWNGAAQTTVYGSSTEISTEIAGSFIATPGTADITVFNPLPGGGTSTIETFTISKITPEIVWSNPADVTYGATTSVLTATQLNASSSVAGSFEYTPDLGTILEAGLQLLATHFTPTDSANYDEAEAEVSLTVLKADQVITWSNPADIDRGTALSEDELNAIITVPGPEAAGEVTYDPILGTVLEAGTHTLSVSVAGSDNYNEASASVSITVIPGPVSHNADLLALETTAGELSPEFDSATTAYSVILPVGTTETPDVFATTTDTAATAMITPATDILSATTSDRTTTVMVTAEDTTTVKNYLVTFNIDNTPPVITITGSSTINIIIGDDYDDAGATAIDNAGNSVTVTASSSIDTDIAGTYTVEYTAEDIGGNTSTATRTVIVRPLGTDATLSALSTSVGTLSPVFSSSTHEYTVLLPYGTTETPTTFATTTDPFATIDEIENAENVNSIILSERRTIVRIDAEDETQYAEYLIVFNVATTPDVTAPVITILGDTSVHILVGATYIDDGATATDNFDGDLTDAIITTSDVDTDVRGTYHVTYTVTDSSENSATSTRTVVVATRTQSSSSVGGRVTNTTPADTTTVTATETTPENPQFGPNTAVPGQNDTRAAGNTNQGQNGIGPTITDTETPATTTDLATASSSDEQATDTNNLAAAGSADFPWTGTLLTLGILIILGLTGWYFYSRQNNTN